MIIPNIVKITDDEDFLGWIFCLAEINQLSVNDFIRHYFYKNSPKINNAVIYPKNLGELSRRYSDQGFPCLQDIMFNHTDLMVESLLGNPNYMTTKVMSIINKITDKYRNYKKRPFLYCPVCVKEDMATHKRIIAHVPHQIDKVTSCYKHGINLSEDPNAEEIPADKKDIRRAQFLQTIYHNHPTINRKAFLEKVESKYPKVLYNSKAIAHLDIGFIDMLIECLPLDEVKGIVSGQNIKKIFSIQKCPDCGADYFSFNNYNECPICKIKVGEKRIMNCGLVAEIIAYREYNDIDVLFENGIVKTGVSYGGFRNGLIGIDNLPSFEEIKQERMGKKTLMHCGMIAKIVAYRNVDDIDVLFEDGSLREHVQYHTFLRGNVRPIKMISNKELKKIRLGEKRLMSNGLFAEIIKYRKISDIDIRFEDGSIRTNVHYVNFLNGKVSPTKLLSVKEAETDRLEEKRIMNCGLEAKIIRYHRAYDMDVLFETGEIRSHVTYTEFKGGSICPVKKISFLEASTNRVGERKLMKCGLTAEIIRYVDAKNIDVKFVENGRIRRHVQYALFKKGGIEVDKKIRGKEAREKRLGEKRMMNCGLEATIIRYNNSNDINVCFENGCERSHVTYPHFLKGAIRPVETLSLGEAELERLGEKRMMNCGIEAVITRYEKETDIDVTFETGEIRTNVTYRQFKKGAISPVKRISLVESTESRLGEKKMMKCGLSAEIIRYGNAVDIDVQFEDGRVRTHLTYDSFQKGNISPERKMTSEELRHSRCGEISMMRCGLKAEIIRYGNCEDIDVRFENGFVRKHVTYGNFKKGKVSLRITG